MTGFVRRFILCHKKPESCGTYTYYENCHFHDYLLEGLNVQEHDQLSDGAPTLALLSAKSANTFKNISSPKNVTYRTHNPSIG